MEKEKYVDESWKEEVSKEKETVSKNEDVKDSENTKKAQEECSCGEKHNDKGYEASHVEVNFMNYITSLGYQTMIFLGEVPNPVTEKTEKSLDQAKFLIDTLIMLREKTNGNLNDQENSFLSSAIYDLELKYVENIEKEKNNDS